MVPDLIWDPSMVLSYKICTISSLVSSNNAPIRRPPGARVDTIDFIPMYFFHLHRDVCLHTWSPC